MKRWADLVDEELTDATPFADKAEFYLQIAQWHVQFDRSGLSTSIDKYFGEAMRHGSNLAHETLKERVASGDERAALVLGDVLLATDNSGSSREEAVAWLRRCDRTDCKNRLA